MNHTHPTLRRDLSALPVPGRRRYRMVIDEIGGRFARVPDRLWQALLDGVADKAAWNQASAAGWTRQRTVPATQRFNPLYVQIPLLPIDSLAAALARHAGWLFGPIATVVWLLVIAVAALLAVSRSGEIVACFGSLQQFLTQTDPLVLGTVFVATKVAHELGHAVACRRVGSRCGKVGVLLLCGMPCPYCDVTDVWRQGSAVRRIAVMLAGIYVELILASLATLIWLLATDPAIRLHAINVMIVCGISTLLFNANPLMRYDGYYVLADLVGSTNLRQESRDAFRAVVIRRWAGGGYNVVRRTDQRAIALSVYHAASTVYRIVVMAAIVAVLLGVADHWGLKRLAIVGVILAVGAWLLRTVRGAGAVAAGGGAWSGVPHLRRWIIVLAPMLLIVAVLFLPLPRYRNANGWIDVSDATTVFLSHDGQVIEVGAEFGDSVDTGDTLLRIRSEPLHYQEARLRGELRLARLRRDRARRTALDRTETAEHWAALQAAEEAVATQLVTTRQRLQNSHVQAPHAGMILPAEPRAQIDSTASLRLTMRIGTAANAHTPWCRISRGGELRAVIVLDGRDRKRIQPASQVKISSAGWSRRVIATTVESVSAIRPDTESSVRQSQYQLECRLPTSDMDDLLSQIGVPCTAVFRLPNRTLAADLSEWLAQWISGELS